MDRLYMLGGAAILCAALTTWALLERNGKLAIKVELTAATGKLATLGEKVQEQNDALQQLSMEAERAQAESARKLRIAEQEAARHRNEVRLLQDALATTTPIDAGGKQAGCNEAWDFIEKNVSK